MKKLFLWFGSIVLSTCTLVQAQKAPVFDSSSHRVRANNVGVYAFSLQDYQLPTGANLTWDLSSALQISDNDQIAFDNSFLKSTNSKFPNSLYYPGSAIYLNPSTSFLCDAYMHQLGTGFYEYSLNKAGVDRFALGQMSGNDADSLIIPAQVIPYSTPRTIIPYPATMSTAWSTRYRTVANGTISVASFALNKTPMSVVTNWTYRDSIVAWGEVIMPVKGGGKSKPYPVLISKRWSTRQDSLYLAGQPAPIALTSAFGATQGSLTQSYRYIALRLDEPNYLFNLSYGSDDTYTLNPKLFLSDLVDIASSVQAEPSHVESSMSPNPASETVWLHIAKQDDAPWSVEFINALGQSVESAMLSAGAGDVNVPLSIVHLQNGVYSALIRNEHQQIVSSTPFVVSK